MTNGSPARVLVTDAHSTSTLAIVRSLSALGMDVAIAGERNRFNLASHSRAVRRTVTLVAAEAEPERYLEQLLAELRRGYDLLIPATDSTVAIVSRARKDIDALVTVALPCNETLEAAVDKQRTIACAREVDVAAPRTWHFDTIDALEAEADRLPYPCVIKPRWSREWHGEGPILRGTVSYADSPSTLRELYRRAPGRAGSFLVQEMVTGTGIGVFAIADHGRPLAVFAHRRIREANPTGGRASLAESIAPDARIVEPALRLLRLLRWHGVAMVEFKDRGAPHAPTLMEINGRFWGSLPLAIAAGVDFPGMLANLMLDRPIDPPREYKVGVRCRHLKGDLSYLVAALKGPPPNWTGAFPSRAAAIAAVIPWPGRWRPYNFRLDDPLPALCEAARYVVDELKSRTRAV